VMASGGGTTPGSDGLGCQFTLDELRTVVDEAHAAGLPVTAHAHALSAVEQALAAGVDGIEHCSFATVAGVRAPAAVVEDLARQRVVVCPTLGQAVGVAPAPALVAGLARAGLTPETAAQASVQVLAELHRHGVVVVSGTDGGISPAKPHGILPRAVAALLDSGIPAADALSSATAAAAGHCGLAARKGRLRPGLDADLLLVDGDPLTDITALERIRAVIVGGRWMVGGPRGSQ
jgi:imidazolonepropionase-like amidohydrolase